MNQEEIEKKEIENMGFKPMSYNDGMLNRGRSSMCVIFDAETNSLHEFCGSDIEGLCVVLSSSYNKNGKWSSTTFQCAIPKHCDSVYWSQDWDNGTYITKDTWQEAFSDFLNLSKFEACSFEAFEAFVRLRLPKAAINMDEKSSKLSSGYCKELVLAKMEREKLKVQIAQEIAKEENRIAEEARKVSEKAEAQEIERKTKEIKEKIKSKKMSLAEMQELYKDL